jgi:hypothetical protein
MSAQKLAFGLLIVLAVIFAVGVGLGVGRAGPAGRPAWATLAHDWFVRERPLQPRDVQGACVSGGRTVLLKPGSPCTVTIRRREGVLIRNMGLALTDGLKVKGVLKPAGDVAGPVSISLQASARTLKLPIVEDGATLELHCAAAIPPTLTCRVAIR